MLGMRRQLEAPIDINGGAVQEAGNLPLVEELVPINNDRPFGQANNAQLEERFVAFIGNQFDVGNTSFQILPSE